MMQTMGLIPFMPRIFGAVSFSGIEGSLPPERFAAKEDDLMEPERHGLSITGRSKIFPQRPGASFHQFDNPAALRFLDSHPVHPADDTVFMSQTLCFLDFKAMRFQRGSPSLRSEIPNMRRIAKTLDLI